MISAENSVATVPIAYPRPDAGFGVRAIRYESADGTDPSAATILALADVEYWALFTLISELRALTVLQNAGAADEDPDANTHRPIPFESE